MHLLYVYETNWILHSNVRIWIQIYKMAELTIYSISPNYYRLLVFIVSLIYLSTMNSKANLYLQLKIEWQLWNSFIPRNVVEGRYFDILVQKLTDFHIKFYTRISRDHICTQTTSILLNPSGYCEGDHSPSINFQYTDYWNSWLNMDCNHYNSCIREMTTFYKIFLVSFLILIFNYMLNARKYFLLLPSVEIGIVVLLFF